MNDPMWVETMIITVSFLAIMMTLVMSVLWLERLEGY
ncbi:small membrane protein YoaI [Trabulsiella odontotermitis]|nr:small membrane protein YoaI [Trabulsiella odontotermitis]WHP33206.1 small membrane protein YoaI [Trabulsiella odontotermitis]